MDTQNGHLNHIIERCLESESAYKLFEMLASSCSDGCGI